MLDPTRAGLPLFVLLVAGLAAQPAPGKPLITSSEETPARLCLAAEDTPERVAQLCRMALAEAGITPRSRSQLLTALGEAEHGLGDADAAIATLDEAIALDPSAAEPHSALGWVYWAEDREAEALPHFRISVDIRAGASNLSGLGSALFHSGEGTAEEALDILDLALAIAPGDPWILREKAWISRADGDLDAAAAGFRAALGASELDANAHYGLAHVLSDMGTFEEALVHLGRAVQLAPGDPDLYVLRAYVLRRLDRNAQAIPDADQVIAALPDSAAGYVNKALALAGLERWAEALAVLEDGYGRGIRDNFLLYWYADVLSDDGQLDRALQVIDEAIAAPGANASDYNLKAYIANEMKEFEVALGAADAAVAQDPKMAYGHFQAAVALVGLDRLEPGLARFDTAMELGLPDVLVGAFVSHLITHGKPMAAISLRRKY